MNKVEKAKNVFQENVDTYRKMVVEIRKNAIDFLTQLLNANNNKIDCDDERGFLDGVCVTYDGGNHPEYAMGISSVSAISLDECGVVWFTLEEEEVEVDRIDTGDLVWVVEDLIKLM